MTLRRLNVVLLWTLLATSCGGGTDQGPLEAATSVVAPETASDSLGFSVDDNGWTFQNYAADGDAQFTVIDAIALFGDAAVCVETTGDCTPTPAAAEWIAMVAASTAGGVCEGMTVTSADRFLVGADPITGDLALTSDVQRRLARLFATQFLDDVIEATEAWRNQSIAAIVGELQIALADPDHEQYTLGIYSEVGGHSVLPYAVDLNEQGKGVIHIYDPNWPGRQRYLEVDAATNQWRFSYFSSDQADDADAWTGGNGSMDLTPLSVREAPFPEPFSGAGTGTDGHLLAISSDDRNWTLTTGDGQTITGATAMPGQNGVVAVTRGAASLNEVAGQDLVLTRWDAQAELHVEAGEVSVLVITPSGAGTVTLETGSAVTFGFSPVEDFGELAVDLQVAQGTKATVRMASTTERVTFEAPEQSNTKIVLKETSTALKVVDQNGRTTTEIEVERSDQRTDLVIDATGQVAYFAPEKTPEQERSVAVEEIGNLIQRAPLPLVDQPLAPTSSLAEDTEGPSTLSPDEDPVLLVPPEGPFGTEDPEETWFDDRGCEWARWQDGSQGMRCQDEPTRFWDPNGEELEPVDFDQEFIEEPPPFDDGRPASINDLPPPDRMELSTNPDCMAAFWDTGASGEVCMDGSGSYTDVNGQTFHYEPGSIDLPDSGGFPDTMLDLPGIPGREGTGYDDFPACPTGAICIEEPLEPDDFPACPTGAICIEEPLGPDDFPAMPNPGDRIYDEAPPCPTGAICSDEPPIFTRP